MEYFKRLIQYMTASQQAAYGAGAVLALLGGALLFMPGLKSWHSKGPANVGHSRIDCKECHVPAAGNLFGQTFTNTLYSLGLVEQGVDFVFTPAGTEQCLACHDNPDDRHPVADFTEPEFAEARREVGADSCINCHREHRGVRVTETPLACQYCHQETALEKDPLDIPHTELVAARRWQTCLGCHDFHGNHEHEVPTDMDGMISEQQIRDYFDGGESPYGYRRLSVIQTMRREQGEP